MSRVFGWFLRVTTILVVPFPCWVAAVAYTQTTLQEENRRLIERNDQRLISNEIMHSMQMAAMQARFDRIEERLFYLMLTTGGTGTFVLADKANYYRKARQKNGENS